MDQQIFKMCGINGFYSNSASTFNNVIAKMNLAISHRGPDSNGSWSDKKSGIVLGHQRLSILDLSIAGHQPMKSNSERYILTYNGEVYNHLEIRDELNKSSANIKWIGNSDTETLIEAIEFWGIETSLKKIEGMFAFALWDQKLHTLTLARDRMGEKPIYYGWQGKGKNKVFIFGSELKSIKLHPEFEGEINRHAIALQLRHNCIPAPYSIYKDMYKLLPGHYLQLKENDLKINSLPHSKIYWSLTKKIIHGNNTKIDLSEKEIKNELEQKLKLSIKKQMLSDVPVGAFLSGGIDSSTIVALMQLQSSNPIKTFTIGFDENDFNEAKYAKNIAKHIGTDHTELYVSSKEAMEIIPKLPSIYDEPFSDSSQIPTYLVSQLTKKHVKVAISGDGGDELFCGYNRHVMIKKLSSLFSYMPIKIRKILSNVLRSMSSEKLVKILKLLPFLNCYKNLGEKLLKTSNVIALRSINDVYSSLCSHWQNPTEIVINSKELAIPLGEIKKEIINLGIQEQIMILDAMTYLPDDILVKVDRAAMSSSLETRAPFLDHKLIEYVWKLPQHFKYRKGEGKWILKQILSQHVPQKFTQRPKMGFGIPIEKWLSGSLKDWAENLLDEKRLQQDGYFNPKLVRDKWEEHILGKKNWHLELWDVLMFQAWKDANT